MLRIPSSFSDTTSHRHLAGMLAEPRFRKRTMQLLLAEDEQKTIDYLTKGLREDGHAVDAVGNGADALAMALADEFDAIILDVMLPGLDGWEVLRRLRAAGRTTPVLFLTAHRPCWIADRGIAPRSPLR